MSCHRPAVGIRPARDPRSSPCSPAPRAVRRPPRRPPARPSPRRRRPSGASRRQPPSRRRPRSRAARRRSASRWTGPRTPTTRGSTSPRRRAGTRDAGVDLQILPVLERDARDPDRRRPGRVRDQLPGRDDLRGRRRRADRLGHGDPPAHGPGDRRPGSSAIKRPRDLDGKTYAGFGYPNEEPTLKAVIKADGGKGDFTTVTLDTAAYEALYAKPPTSRSRSRPGKASRPAERGIAAADLQVHRLRLPGLLPGRPRLRPPLADRAAGRRPARSSRPPPAGFEFAADRSRRSAAAILIAQNPGVFDGNPTLPLASQRLPGQRRVPARRRTGNVGRQTLDRVDRATRASSTTRAS